ncbi:protein CDV3 homolog [Hyalella azteca]|uniref:Protein CDV3 homolog n=1 Tax=Hyalella azteca TaxID=294128 RepID=A0A8B7N789_HYAAZ|nr:protein CDV3 homolog [Hyalella azteca]
MADLDSFFAKKDKKKVKGKKFTTTEEIARRLNDTEKKVASATKNEISKKLEECEDGLSTSKITAVPELDDAEVSSIEKIPEVDEKKVVEEEQWDDFKDDYAVDVSNLRITNMITDNDDEGGRASGEGGDDSKLNSGDDKKEGVWKIEEQQKSLESTICEALDADDDMQGVKAQIAARNAQPRWTSQNASEMKAAPLPRGSRAIPGSRRKKEAPDITNATAFPTLADAKTVNPRKKVLDDRDVPEVRVSHNTPRGRDTPNNPQAYRPPMLRTNNRFGALTDQSSLVKHN